jgi:Mrp family chromosome partitioning ATPase
MPAEIGGAPLRVLAVKSPDVAVADRLSYAIAEDLLKSAKEDAEFVVIDSPPITAVIDALPLARLADDVLVVSRLGVSKLGVLSELRDILTEYGSYPTGMVLVGDTPGQAGYYYAAAEPIARRGRGDGRGQPLGDAVRTRSD